MRLSITNLKNRPNDEGIPYLQADRILTSTEGTVLLGVQADEVEEFLKSAQAIQVAWHNLRGDRQELPADRALPANLTDEGQGGALTLFKDLQRQYPKMNFVIKIVEHQPTLFKGLTTKIALRITGMHKLVKNLLTLANIKLSGNPLSSFLAPTLVLNLDGQVVVIQPKLEDPTTEQLQGNLNLLSCLTLATPRLLKKYGILLDFVGTAGAILAKQQKTGKGKQNMPDLPPILSNLKWDPVQQRLVFVDIIAASLPETKRTSNYLQRLFITMLMKIQLETMAYLIGALNQNEQAMDACPPFSLGSRILLTLGQIIGLG